jgi:Immunity protein 74
VTLFCGGAGQAPSIRRRSVEIINVSRGYLRLRVGERTMKLSGEAMASGSPVNFYADLVSIKQWEDSTPVTDAERDEIVRELPEVARKRGWVLVIN